MKLKKTVTKLKYLLVARLILYFENVFFSLSSAAKISVLSQPYALDNENVSLTPVTGLTSFRTSVLASLQPRFSPRFDRCATLRPPPTPFNRPVYDCFSVNVYGSVSYDLV